MEKKPDVGGKPATPTPASSSSASVGSAASPGPATKSPLAPAASSALPQADGPITPDMERILQRRPGFTYFYTFLDWPNQKKPLMLLLCNASHRVFVSTTRPDSLANDKLKPHDRIVAINNCPISDKNVARAIITSSGGRFGLLVERPESDKAKAEFAQLVSGCGPIAFPPAPGQQVPAAALAAMPSPSSTPTPAPASAPPAPASPAPTTPAAPSPAKTGGEEAPALSVLAPPPVAPTTAIIPYPVIPTPPDVLTIINKHMTERKAGLPPPKPILKGKAMLRTDSKCSMSESIQEIVIPCDLDPEKMKKLRKVNAPKPKPPATAPKPPATAAAPPK